MKYKIIKNQYVLGRLCKMGTEIEIDEKDIEYYDGVVEKIETSEKVATDKPNKKKAVK